MKYIFILKGIMNKNLFKMYYFKHIIYCSTIHATKHVGLKVLINFIFEFIELPMIILRNCNHSLKEGFF